MKQRTKARLAGSIICAAVLISPSMALASPATPSATGCWKSGYGESSGEGGCPEEYGDFKIQVWCTWGGSGLSSYPHVGYNWASCNRGSVRTIDFVW